MARSTPLPDTLNHLPFTVYESRAQGVSAKRLRAKDLADGGRLIYLPRGRELELWERARVLAAATPGEWVSRTTPYAYKDGLRLLIRQHPNMKGVEKARQALDEMRVGADSYPETFLRLAMLDAHLPEPELQLRVDPSDPWSPTADLGYRRFRIALQYDGAHHLSREQQSRDNRRDEAFISAGWTYFKVNADDLEDGFQRVISRVKCAKRRSS